MEWLQKWNNSNSSKKQPSIILSYGWEPQVFWNSGNNEHVYICWGCNLDFNCCTQYDLIQLDNGLLSNKNFMCLICLMFTTSYVTVRVMSLIISFKQFESVSSIIQLVGFLLYMLWNFTNNEILEIKLFEKDKKLSKHHTNI